MEEIKDNFYQKGQSDLGGIIVLGTICLVVWVIASLLGFNHHSTSEGTVNYSDCREIITLQPDDWHTYFGTFIGTTMKTQSGRIMGGEFVRIENDSSFFGNSHTCATAYIYQKKQANICNDPYNPYLGYDDRCYSTPQ